MRSGHQRLLLFRQIDKKLFKSLYDSALALLDGFRYTNIR